ncbi:hypothetical protein EBV26_07395 [bacterium]|nr:hypothetical protein [bacterium]
MDQIYNIYNMFTKMTPETRELLINTLNHIAKVAAAADAAADAAAADKAADDAADDAARRAEYATADAVIERYKQNGSKPIDIHDVYDLWKHTPEPKKGGSRKRSINCRRPRGFSQRQHCKYGRRGWGRKTTRRQEQ